MDKISSEATKNLFAEYVMPTYAPQLVFARGEGAYLFDPEGNRYLDFAAGIAVCNLGHCHPAITEAIRKQAGELLHVSNLFMNTNAPQLAQKLIESGFDGKVFFCNSGAEANEGLIKFARKWGNQTGRNEIIAMEDSFHGRTLATLAATGRSKYRKGFEPDVTGFKHVKFNDIEALKAAITSKTCAVLMEPVQGEGGIIPGKPEYIKAVRQLCDEKNILLLFDEVQCGIGRVGELYAHQLYGVEPDAFSLAKALGNGLPIGAFLVTHKYADILTVGTHASTFGGNAVSAAAAIAVIDTIKKDNILEHVKKIGDYLQNRLREITAGYDFVQEVRGKGLMIGVVLDSSAAPLQKILMKYNLITLTAGETVLRLVPPLIITEKECEEALAAIEKGLKEFSDLKREESKI